MNVATKRSRIDISKNVYQLVRRDILRKSFRKVTLPERSRTLPTGSSTSGNRSLTRRLERTCEHCKEKFRVTPPRMNNRFCGRTCWHAHARKLPLESVKDLIAGWFRDGLSALEIAKKLGVGRTTILRIERKLGLIYKPHGSVILDCGNVRNLSETEKAYVAGLFDGEGNISLTISTDNAIRNEVAICNTDKVIIQLCQILFPHHRTRRNTGHNGNSVMYVLYAHDKRNILLILETLIPYLKLKRKRAELMVEFCKNRMDNFGKPLNDREKSLVGELRLLNSEKGKAKKR